MSKSKAASDITRKNVERIAQLEQSIDQRRAMGDRIADGFARVVGSWAFICIQSTCLVLWLAVNCTQYAWDPYPFILLNLALSFQAAYATPIIMMSQNRQDRLASRRNRLDLQINLLSEQESTRILQLLRRLCEHAGIDTAEIDEKGLEDPVSPADLLNQIDAAQRNKAP